MLFKFFITTHVSTSFVRSLVPQLNKLTQDDLISDLKGKADGQTVVDLKPLLARITVRTISQVRDKKLVFLQMPYSFKHNYTKPIQCYKILLLVSESWRSQKCSTQLVLFCLLLVHVITLYIV